MSQPGESNRDLRDATTILANLAQDYDGRVIGRPVLTPGVALALAGHLCHLAGGDGRGAFRIVHDPSGDRLSGLDRSDSGE